VLLKYKELKGIIPGVTKLSVDMAQSLGKDPAAAAEFLGRALQKPFDAANKLAKEGIVLTDSQKQTLEAFKKTGDTAGAQAFLMQQLNSTYAGSAKAAADAAGGSVQFKARMGEVAENLATAALPLLDKLGQILNDYVAPAIETVAGWIGDNLPAGIAIATKAVSSVIAWFSQASTESGGLSDAIAGVTAWFNDSLLPALDQVWQFIQANVIPIVETLVNVAFAVLKADIRILAAIWTTVLWPALQKIWLFVRDNIIPILAQLIVWIKDNLPPAIRVLADLWNNTLLPALRAVWDFISTKVLPILNAIGDVINAVLIVAFKLVAGIIMNTVVPALEKIWSYIDQKVIPVLKQIGETISTYAAPAFSTLGALIEPVVGYFSSLVGTISDVVSWLETLASKINSIKIPSWAGGSGGGGGGGGGSSGGESAPPPEPIHPEPVGQSAGRQSSGRASAGTQSVGGGGGGTTVRIVFDAGAMAKLIKATVEDTLAQSGTQSFARIRTGN
jgi:phage-related protein